MGAACSSKSSSSSKSNSSAGSSADGRPFRRSAARSGGARERGRRGPVGGDDADGEARRGAPLAAAADAAAAGARGGRRAGGGHARFSRAAPPGGKGGTGRRLSATELAPGGKGRATAVPRRAVAKATTSRTTWACCRTWSTAGGGARCTTTGRPSASPRATSAGKTPLSPTRRLCALPAARRRVRDDEARRRAVWAAARDDQGLDDAGARRARHLRRAQGPIQPQVRHQLLRVRVPALLQLLRQGAIDRPRLPGAGHGRHHLRDRRVLGGAGARVPAHRRRVLRLRRRRDVRGPLRPREESTTSRSRAAAA